MITKTIPLITERQNQIRELIKNTLEPLTSMNKEDVIAIKARYSRLKKVHSDILEKLKIEEELEVTSSVENMHSQIKIEVSGILHEAFKLLEYGENQTDLTRDEHMVLIDVILVLQIGQYYFSLVTDFKNIFVPKIYFCCKKHKDAWIEIYSNIDLRNKIQYWWN